MSTTIAVDPEAARRRTQLRDAADRYFAALAAHRIEDVPYAQEVVLRSPLAPPDGQIPYERYPIRGRDAVQAWFRSIYPLLGATNILGYYFDEALTTIASRADVNITTDPPCVLRVIDRFVLNDRGEIVEQENHYDPRPVTQGVSAADEGALTAAERDLLLDMLDAGCRALLQALDEVAPDQWTFRPAAGAWSIGECAEHLVLTDQALLAHVREQIMAAPADPARRAEVRGKDGAVVSAMRDRTGKLKTFDFLEPRGRYPDRAAVVAAFEQARAVTVDYVRSTADGLHDRFAPLPGVGDLDGYQWLLLIAAHTERHVAQIAEIKTHPHFPQ